MSDARDDNQQAMSSLLLSLENHGIKPTAQRLSIAAFLTSKNQHATAESILSAVNSEGPVVSKATVYNTLNLFVEKGLLREVLIDPSRVYYDSNTTPHYHLFNEDTGELTDIDISLISPITIPNPYNGLVLEKTDLILRVRSRRNNS